MSFTSNKGPAAANLYLNTNDGMQSTLTLDWSFDSFYYKYKNDPWITLSYGPNGDKHESDKIINSTDDYKSVFIELAKYAMTELKSYSGNSDKALTELQKIIQSELEIDI